MLVEVGPRSETVVSALVRPHPSRRFFLRKGPLSRAETRRCERVVANGAVVYRSLPIPRVPE